MPYSHVNQTTLEQSPNYFDEPTAPGRIYKMNRSIRLILVLTDPIERALAEFTQFEKNGVSFRKLGHSFEVDARLGKHLDYVLLKNRQWETVI